MYLNIEQVCKLTGVGKTSIYHLIKTAGFPAPRKVTRSAVRWKESEVTAWMDARPRSTRCESGVAAQQN